MNMLNSVSPYVLLVLTTLFWGSNFNLGRFVQGEIPPLGLSFWRWFVAWSILVLFIWKPMYQAREIAKSHWKLLLGLSILGVASFNSFVYIGLQWTIATNAVLLQSVCPIFTIVFAALFVGERTQMIQWVGVLTSILGIFYILSEGTLTQLLDIQFNQGDLVILLAVLSWALYTVFLRKLPDELKGIVFLGYSITIGMLIILPFYLYESLFIQPTSFNLLTISSVSYVALFPSLLAYLFWNHATSQLGANTTSQFIHLIPVFGTLIAMLILQERLQSYHFVGAIFVILGLVLSNKLKKAH